jgi:hypothetical protein
MKVPVMCCVSFIEVKQNSDVKHQFKVCDFDIEDNNITNLVMFDKFKDIIKTLSDDCKLKFDDMSTLKAYRKKLPFKTLGELKNYLKTLN